MPPKKAVARLPSRTPASPAAVPGSHGDAGSGGSEAVGDLQSPSASAAAAFHPPTGSYSAEPTTAPLDPLRSIPGERGGSIQHSFASAQQHSEAGASHSTSRIGAGGSGGAVRQRLDAPSGQHHVSEQPYGTVAREPPPLGETPGGGVPHHGQEGGQAAFGAASTASGGGDKPLWKPTAGPRRATVKLPARSGGTAPPAEVAEAGLGSSGAPGRAGAHAPPEHSEPAPSARLAPPPAASDEPAAARRASLDRHQAPPGPAQGPGRAVPSASSGGGAPHHHHRDSPDDFRAAFRTADPSHQQPGGGDGARAAAAAASHHHSFDPLRPSGAGAHHHPPHDDDPSESSPPPSVSADADADDLVLHSGGGGGGGGGNGGGLKHRHHGQPSGARRPQPPESPIRKLMAAARRGTAAVHAAAISRGYSVDLLLPSPLLGSSLFRLVLYFSAGLLLLASFSKLVAFAANAANLSHSSFLSCGWRFSGYIPGPPTAPSHSQTPAGPGRFADGGSADIPPELSAYAFDDSEWLPTNVASDDPGEYGGPSGEPCEYGCHWYVRSAPMFFQKGRVTIKTCTSGGQVWTLMPSCRQRLVGGLRPVVLSSASAEAVVPSLASGEQPGQGRGRRGGQGQGGDAGAGAEAPPSDEQRLREFLLARPPPPQRQEQEEQAQRQGAGEAAAPPDRFAAQRDTAALLEQLQQQAQQQQQQRGGVGGAAATAAAATTAAKRRASRGRGGGVGRRLLDAFSGLRGGRTGARGLLQQYGGFGGPAGGAHGGGAGGGVSCGHEFYADVPAAGWYRLGGRGSHPGVSAGAPVLRIDHVSSKPRNAQCGAKRAGVARGAAGDARDRLAAAVRPTVGKESGIGRGCKWAFSGARPGHPSGYQPELTDYKLDTRDWTLVDIESDRYVGEQPCEECHWFVRSAPMWIDADSTIVFHTCRSGDEVWTLVPKEPSLCPLDIGGDAYDTDGLGRGCMNMYSFHVRQAGYYIWAGRGSHGGAGLGSFKYLLIEGVHASTGSVGCRGLSRSARFGGALPPKQHAAPTPLQLAVMEAAASPLCPGAVRAAVTMPTNAHHFEIAMLQREVMLRLGLTCTLARLVTVCLDSPCLSLCERKRVPRCIPLGTELKGGDFGDESWLRIAAAKWALMQEAVSTGVNALLLDDDVLVLGDVFAVVGRTEYDVQYSPKFLGPPDNCAGDANAGVVFVRATTAGRGFLDAMVSFKPRIEGAAKMSLDQSHLLLDQELFPEAITTAQAKRCILPPAQFAGHCRHARNATLRLGDLMTFHATCTETAARKLAVLQGVADAIGEPGYADRTLVSVDPDEPSKPARLFDL